MKKINFLILVILLVSSSSIAQSIVIGSGASIYVPSGADVCAESYGNITGNIYGEGKQCKQLPLPVELTLFTASVKDNQVLLKWRTETEVDNYGFDVERASSPTTPSQDEWEKLGFVDGNGNSNSPKEYSFIDESPPVGNIKYRLKQIDTDGQFEYSDVVDVEIKEALPTEYKLFQNYPNPFNPSTYISFAFPKQSHVRLVVYNLLGQEVAEILNTTMEAGVHNVVFDASSIASGTYIYRLETPAYTAVKKMVILK